MYRDDESSEIPRRATSGSAGYDFFAPCDIEIPANTIVDIDTHVRLSDDESVFFDGKRTDQWVLMVLPRSSLGRKYGFTILNTVGVIDKDYRDSIGLRVMTSKDLLIEKGKAFAQGIFVPFGVTAGDHVTTVRTGGMGSTDAQNNGN